MYFSNDYLTERVVKERIEKALKMAEMNRWLREAGLRRQGGLSRTGCWLLCQLGRLLEAWGSACRTGINCRPFLWRSRQPDQG